MIEQLLYISLAIFGIQLFFNLIAAAFRTDKVTDLAYGSTFVAVVLFLFFYQSQQTDLQMLVTVGVSLWGIRLAGYLFRRILHMKKDTRFDGMREQWWSFAKFWLLQTIAIVIVLLPSIFVLYDRGDHSIDLFVLGGGLIFLLGLCIETIADGQKYLYKRQYPQHRVNTGLWSYARHPNYFGEILVWVGVWLMSISTLQGWEWISIISPIFIIVLLLYVSGIPLLEKQREKRYGDDIDFQTWKKKTRLLVPLP